MLGRMQFGVLVLVKFGGGGAGGWWPGAQGVLFRSSDGAVIRGAAGVQSSACFSLSGVCAGVFWF